MEYGDYHCHWDVVLSIFVELFVVSVSVGGKQKTFSAIFTSTKQRQYRTEDDNRSFVVTMAVEKKGTMVSRAAALSDKSL